MNWYREYTVRVKGVRQGGGSPLAGPVEGMHDTITYDYEVLNTQDVLPAEWLENVAPYNRPSETAEIRSAQVGHMGVLEVHPDRTPPNRVRQFGESLPFDPCGPPRPAGLLRRALQLVGVRR